MITFYKTHGLGNDFVVFRAAAFTGFDPARTAARLCDRHFGVGADGVLLIGPGDANSDVGLQILNPDGSEPEMCGNGIRCAVKVCVDHFGIGVNPVRVNTAAGVMTCHWDGSAAGGVQTVTVNMGEARIGPMAPDAVAVTRANSAIIVNIGNPHVILFGDFPSDTPLQLGPQVQTLPTFPYGVNVNFARVTPPHSIQLMVYERGAGLTLACGTGACATTAAAVFMQWLAVGEPITVSLPGGNLTTIVNYTAPDTPNRLSVTMRGPAEVVFQGKIEPSKFFVARASFPSISLK